MQPKNTDAVLGNGNFITDSEAKMLDFINGRRLHIHKLWDVYTETLKESDYMFYYAEAFKLVGIIEIYFSIYKKPINNIMVNARKANHKYIPSNNDAEIAVIRIKEILDNM